MIIETFQEAHLAEIHIQNAQREQLSLALEEGVLGQGFTIKDDNGKILACTGVFPMGSSSGFVWSYLSSDASENLLALTRIGHHILNVFHRSSERLEAFVELGFDQGERWLRMLGFERTLNIRKDSRGKEYIQFVRDKQCSGS